MNQANSMNPIKTMKKGVVNFNKGDYSYANSVLISLSCLDCIRELTFRQEILNKILNSNFILAKDFFNLIFILNRMSNQEACSQEIINSFTKIYDKYKS